MIGAAGAEMAELSAQPMADMRYIGQGFEITVPLPDDAERGGVRAAFEARYRALFTRIAPDAAIEVVAVRLSLQAPMPGAQGAITLREQGRARARRG